MKSVSEIEQLVADETKRRLEEMESPDYDFCATILKKDFALIGVIIGINLILIILAMTGGIK